MITNTSNIRATPHYLAQLTFFSQHLKRPTIPPSLHLKYAAVVTFTRSGLQGRAGMILVVLSSESLSFSFVDETESVKTL